MTEIGDTVSKDFHNYCWSDAGAMWNSLEWVHCKVTVFKTPSLKPWNPQGKDNGRLWCEICDQLKNKCSNRVQHFAYNYKATRKDSIIGGLTWFLWYSIGYCFQTVNLTVDVMFAIQTAWSACTVHCFLGHYIPYPAVNSLLVTPSTDFVNISCSSINHWPHLCSLHCKLSTFPNHHKLLFSCFSLKLHQLILSAT